MDRWRPRLLVVLFVLLAHLMPSTTWGRFEAVEYPERPEQREFIADEAKLLSATDRVELREQLDKLLDETAIPIIVVTIERLADYGAMGVSIEAYAQMLFNHWGIGHERIRVKGAGWGREETVGWNKGILLLVSVGNRKARIELGADYGHSKDYLCQKIMGEHIIPHFKAGDYSGGIRAGVTALAAMARGEKLPMPPRPWWHYGLVVLFIVLAIWTATSLAQSGASGYAWVFWGVVFSILGAVLWAILTSKGSGRGGFSGGSFGGGFSGGGGATGSW